MGSQNPGLHDSWTLIITLAVAVGIYILIRVLQKRQ